MTEERLRDSATRLERWDKVDKGASLILLVVIAAAAVCGALGFVGFFTGCTPQGEQPSIQWPPEVALDGGHVHGYVDIQVANGTIQRFALDSKTEAGELAGGDVRVVAWGVNGHLDARVNGRTQEVFVESTNARKAAGWVHCFSGGLALEWADEGTVRATGIPPGFSAECGPPGVEISVPFLGWDVSFSRGVPGPVSAPGPRGSDTADSPADNSADSVTPCP